MRGDTSAPCPILSSLKGSDLLMTDRRCILCGVYFLGPHNALRCPECRLDVHGETQAQCPEGQKRNLCLDAKLMGLIYDREKARSMREDGVSVLEIADIMGVSKQWVSKVTTLGAPPNWTKQEEKTLRELAAEGHAHREIAKTLNRSISAVRVKLHRLRALRS